MKNLLITGFEPFDGETVNPSWEVVDRLPNMINGYILHKLRVPVVFGEAARAVLSAAEDVMPDVILCVGQAGGRACITPEMVGINLRNARIPDNSGYQPVDEAIIPGGANAYFSSLPVRRISEAIKNVGISSEVSYSAGTYVCNDVLYSLLARFEGTKTKCGFIHVPYSREQKKEPSMTMEDIILGLTAAIEALDKNKTNP